MLHDKDFKNQNVSCGEVQLWIQPGEDVLAMPSAKAQHVGCRSEFTTASVVKLGSSFSSYWYDMM